MQRLKANLEAEELLRTDYLKQSLLLREILQVTTHAEISKLVLHQLADHQQAYVAGFADDTE